MIDFNYNGAVLSPVKGDNLIDSGVTKAKAEAAAEMATHSKMSYVMHASNDIMRKGVI